MAVTQAPAPSSNQPQPAPVNTVVSVIYAKKPLTQGTIVTDNESIAFLKLSEASFAEDWNSDADSVYDDGNL